MTQIELDIKNLDNESIFKKLKSICSPDDLTENISLELHHLSNNLVSLEKQKWNGIWARIITNFLTTANLGKFNLIVGNPLGLTGKTYLRAIGKELNQFVLIEVCFQEIPLLEELI